jgi:hypothetical protein
MCDPSIGQSPPTRSLPIHLIFMHACAHIYIHLAHRSVSSVCLGIYVHAHMCARCRPSVYGGLAWESSTDVMSVCPARANAQVKGSAGVCLLLDCLLVVARNGRLLSAAGRRHDDI